MFYRYHNCSSLFLEGRESSELVKTLVSLNKEHGDIPFKCAVILDNGSTYGYDSDSWGKCRYFFIQRQRCMITKEYIEENLNNSYLVRPFASYVEAYRYMQNGFWDDSCYGVYYRTDEGDWLMVSTVN